MPGRRSDLLVKITDPRCPLDAITLRRWHGLGMYKDIKLLTKIGGRIYINLAVWDEKVVKGKCRINTHQYFKNLVRLTKLTTDLVRSYNKANAEQCKGCSMYSRELADDIQVLAKFLLKQGDMDKAMAPSKMRKKDYAALNMKFTRSDRRIKLKAKRKKPR